MASDESDVDDFADLDLATFAKEADSLSPTLADHVQANESSYQEKAVWNQISDSHNICGEVLPQDRNNGTQKYQDAIFEPESDVQTFLCDTESNLPWQQNSPLLESNQLHFDSQEPSLSPLFIDPFCDGLFNSDETFNSVSSKNMTDHSSIINCQTYEKAVLEYVCLNRLPGENLGMVLGIEGDQDNCQAIDAVVVKSVTPGGAVARSCQGDSIIQVGDEILEVDGRPLKELTHDECIALFQTMPDNVVLTVNHREKVWVNDDKCLLQATSSQTKSKRRGVPVPLPRKSSSHPGSQSIIQDQFAEGDHLFFNMNLKDHTDSRRPSRQNDNSYRKVPIGFHKLELTLFRGEEDNLGISIVPSYGATCDLYQIKRLLHSGACAQSGVLEIGDRLLTCNGKSLKGLTQTQCLNVLKSSGSLVKLTVLRNTSDSDQTALREDATGHLSNSSYIETEESISHSNKRNVNISDTPIEHGNYLSESTPLTLRDFKNDTETENIVYNSGICDNNDHIVNIGDIQLLDTFNKTVSKEEGNCILEKKLHADKYFGDSVDTSLPSEFSGTESLQNVQFSSNQSDLPVIFTNIDDLLSGAVENTDTVIPSDDIHISETGDIKNSFDHEDSSVITENNTCTDLLDTAFTSQAKEEFAEDCVSNIAVVINNKVSEQEVSYSTRQSADSHNIALEDSLSNFEDQEKLITSNKSNKLVTVIPVSAVSPSEEYISKIPLSSVNHGEILSTSDSVSVQGRSNTHQTFTRNISVNSQPPICVSHIDVVSSKNIVQEETFSPVENINNAFSSVVFQTHGGSSSSTLKSATIKVSGPFNQVTDMSNQLPSPVIHTTVGLTDIHQSGEEEEFVKPMVVVKDAHGSALCIPSPEPLKGKLDVSRILDNEAKQEIAEVLSAITKTASDYSSSVLVNNGVEEEVSEQEIAPTVLTNDQKQVALDILNQWNATDSPNTVFQKAVSNVIDIQRQPDQHNVPANALVHTTLGISNDGQSEDFIQPMTAAKDHLGKHLYIPSPQSEQIIQDVRKPDDHAKIEIANVMSLFSTPRPEVSQPSWDADQSETFIAEDEIVPMVLSHEQKKKALNVLHNWVNSDEPKEIYVIQHAVTEFKMLHEPNTTYSDSLCTTESLNASMGNAKCDSIPNVSIDTKKVALSPPSNQSVDLNISEHSGLSANQGYSHVVLRNKSKQATDFMTKIDHFQQLQNPTSSVGSISGRRVRSMVDDPPNTTSSPRFDDLHKSFTTEIKPISTFRPLSAIRPLSVSTSNMHHLSSTSVGRPASGSFLSNTFAARTSKTDYPKTRQEDGSPFQVDVLKGLAGLGLKVKVTPEGRTEITEIQSGGPVDKDGQVRVGDYLLFINSTELTGQTDARVQQILRLLPRGLTKLVVSSAAVSSSESQQQVFDNKSYSSLTSAQPTMNRKSQFTPDVTSDAPLASVTTDQPYSFQNKDVHPQVLDMSVESAELSLSSTQLHLSKKVEKPSKNQEAAETSVIFDKPIPTTRSKHDVISPKAEPHHGFLSAVNERFYAATENTKTKESEDSGLNSEVEIASEGSFNTKHDTFEGNQETEISLSAVVPLKPRTHPFMEASPTFNNEQDPSRLSTTLSFPQSPAAEGLNITELQERESLILEGKVDSVRSPPCKIPPPVAPKPRVSLTSLLKSQDSIDGGELTKPLLASSYEKQQCVTKISRPSPVGDMAGSFVSSAARMFDNKAASNDTCSDPTLSARRVSRGVAPHNDSTMINTSLLPPQDRHKSTLIPSPLPLSRPKTLSSSFQPHSRTQSYIEVTTREDITPESSSLSPTHLNAALSPRRTSSVKSPTSPPHSFPVKHVTTSQDKSPIKIHSGKSQAIQQHGIYMSTPLTLITSKSPSHTSHKVKSSPHPDDRSHVVTNEHHSKSFTSPTLHPTMLTNKKASKYVANKFDNLVNDASESHSDSHDRAVCHTVESNHLLSSQIADSSLSQIDDIKKPIALHRRKPEPKESEKEIQGKVEMNEEKVKEDKKTVKIEASKEGSFIEISSLIIAPTEGNICNNSVPLNIQEEVVKSYRISSKGTLETLAEPEKPSRHSNNKSETHNQLLEYNSNTVVNRDQLMHNETVNESVTEQKENKSKPLDGPTHGEEMPEILDNSSLINHLDTAVKKSELQKSEVSETQMEIWKAHASQIVEIVMARIQNTADIFPVSEKMDVTIKPAAVEDEPPPPLPGAPPPPLILRDAKLLVNTQDLVNQNESPIAPEYITEQSTGINSMEVNIITEFLTDKQPDVSQARKPHSVYHLNSTENNIHDSESVKVTSQSHVDMLSEDSGMPADEDQEIATDDTFSHSSEHVETAGKVPIFLEAEIEHLQSNPEVLEWENLIIHSDHKTPKDKEPIFIDVTCKVISKIDKDNDNLPEPLLPTSTCPNITAWHNTNNLEHFLSQPSLPFVQATSSQSVSSEINLLGDDISPDDNRELAQELTVNRAAEVRHEFTRKSEQFQETNIASSSGLLFYPGASIHNNNFQTTDTTSVTITSKRRWCLKSNKSGSPVISGDSHVPVKIGSTVKGLVSSLTANDLKCIIDKANGVLDAVSATDSLSLMVVHIHQEEDSMPLSVDLTHKGDIWFQVSHVTNGSQLLDDGGVVTGDWLMSVDGLWCDDANLISFQSRLTEQNHDLLLVLARGEKSGVIQETTSVKPVPLPRSRSANKQQQADEQMLNVASDVDFLDSVTKCQDTLPLIETSLGENKGQQKLSVSEQDTELQQHFSEAVSPVCLTTENSLPKSDSIATHSDPIPVLANQVPALIYQVPSLTDQVPALKDQIPSLQDQEALIIQDQEAPVLPYQDAPQLSNQETPLPYLEEALPEERQFHTDQTPSVLYQVSTHASPILDEAGPPKETPQFQTENTPTSPRKIPQPVYKEPAFPVKSDPVIETSPSKNVFAAKVSDKIEINGTPCELVTSSSRISEPVQEHLPVKKSSGAVDSSNKLGSGIHQVVMIKGATGVGFCLEGGMSSPRGNLPITISRIFKGGPAEKCGKLKVKDEILEVNGVRFDSMARYEAWNHLKFLDDGEVHLTVRRH